MVEWFAKLTNLPTEAMPMPSTMASGPGVPGEAGPTGHALALAVAARHHRRERRINLRQGDLAKAGEAGIIRQNGGLIAVCALCIVLAFGFSTLARYRTLVAETEALEEQLAEISDKRLGKATRSPRAARKILKKGSGKKDPMPRFDAYAALDAISGAIPNSIVHDVRKLKLNLDDSGEGGSFQLQGSIPDVKSRDVIAGNLAENECIFEIEKGQTTSMPGKDRTSYTIQGKLGCPGSPARNAAKKGKRGKKAKKKR